MDDKEEQLQILSTFVRLGILVWSGGILTLAYIIIDAYSIHVLLAFKAS